MRLSPEAKIRDATWAVAYGLALWGLTGDTDAPRKPAFAKLGASLGKLFGQFMP